MIRSTDPAPHSHVEPAHATTTSTPSNGVVHTTFNTSTVARKALPPSPWAAVPITPNASSEGKLVFSPSIEHEEKNAPEQVPDSDAESLDTEECFDDDDCPEGLLEKSDSHESLDLLHYRELTNNPAKT